MNNQNRSHIKRTDTTGRAHAGSQKHIQHYVNFDQNTINKEIADNIGANNNDIEWVSPLKRESYREYQGAEFLDALNLGFLKNDLAAFWPAKGPVWDALGTFSDNSRGDGIVLVEAKAHIAELSSGGCKAKSESSICLIQSSIRKTKSWLNVPDKADWLNSNYYQYANRLCHLYFFIVVAKINTFLFNVYFTRKNSHSVPSKEEYKEAIKDIKSSLMLPQKLPKFSCNIFLPI